MPARLGSKYWEDDTPITMFVFISGQFIGYWWNAGACHGRKAHSKPLYKPALKPLFYYGKMGPAYARCFWYVLLTEAELYYSTYLALQRRLCLPASQSVMPPEFKMWEQPCLWIVKHTDYLNQCHPSISQYLNHSDPRVPGRHIYSPYHNTLWRFLYKGKL